MRQKQTLFGVVQEKLETDEIPWTQFVSLSVDNTNSMVGTHNSLASSLKEKIQRPIYWDDLGIWRTLQQVELMTNLQRL